MRTKIIRNIIFFLFIVYASSNHNFSFLIEQSKIFGIGIGRGSLLLSIILSYFIKPVYSIRKLTSMKFLNTSFIVLFFLLLLKILIGETIFTFKSDIYDLMNFIWIIPLSRALSSTKDISLFLKWILISISTFSASITLLRFFDSIYSLDNSKAVLDSSGFARYMVANAYLGMFGFYYAISKFNKPQKYKLINIIYLFLSIIYILALVLSYSRKLYLFIFFGGILVLLLTGRKRAKLKQVSRLLIIVIISVLFLNTLYQFAGQDIAAFSNRVLSMYTDVEQQSGTYGSRINYIESQSEFWKTKPIYFFIGVIFTQNKENVANLLQTNNGFTEEILLYGLIIASLMLLAYVISAYKALMVFQKSSNPENRTLSIIVLTFMFCSLVIHPVLFSLFHNPLNISGTVVALVIANKLSIFHIQQG